MYLRKHPRSKMLFLPEAHNYPPGPPPKPAESAAPIKPAEHHPCPCCGFLTFPVPREDAIAYICPVCFWENDVFTTSDDEPSDENHGMSLAQGRAAYLQIGACCVDRLQYVRKPLPEEIP